MTHKPVHCQRCRAASLKRCGWHFEIKPDGKAEVFCSDECKAKGLPVRVRESVTAFVDYQSGAPSAFKTGCQDSLYGYDALSTDRDYMKGFTLGNTLRIAASEFAALKDKEQA